MSFTSIPSLWLIILLISSPTTAISFHQPKFCPNASWNPNGITFANASSPFGLFVDINNALYTAEQGTNRVAIRSENKTNPIRILDGNLNGPGAIFVSINGDVYVDNGNNKQVVKWTANGTTGIVVANVTAQCLGLFIDINDTLYCSLDSQHIVKKMPLNGNQSSWTTVAGTGIGGSAANMLQNPNGIFIDINFTLYVADANNNRIQRFYVGQLNGTTVAGNGSSENFTLFTPTGVIMDGNGYLFIVDSYNNRIVGSGPYGFRCIVGCSRLYNSTSTTLKHPRTLGFDSYGNMYVSDRGNSRIQKFLLITNSCDQITTIRQMETTTTTTLNETSNGFVQTTDTTFVTHEGITTKKTTTELSTERRSTNTSITPAFTTATMPIVHQSCFSPMITLIPSASSLSSPLQFRRNQGFYISSNIQLNCNDSFATTLQWTIKNCSSHCSSEIQVGQIIITKFSELYIPARSLPYGTYELKLTVTMLSLPTIFSSNSAYVKITSSDIIPNLIQFGISMITRGHKQDLILDPGRYSINPDEDKFNASDWQYEYYCRIYDHNNFPNIQGSLLTIDDPRIDPLNPSCLSNRSGNETSWKYGGISTSPKSSLTILSGSLSSNQTYQFMVLMKNLHDSSLQATGYLLVQVVDAHSPIIAIACVISTMCASNVEFQHVNPTTQVALYSMCTDNCTLVHNIIWNIYYGSMNSSSNTTLWIQFNQMNLYENIWFFGANTTNFTALTKLFLDNPQTFYWRFEVVYSFLSQTSSSAINFVLNEPPRNGSCSINPLNGTTNTLFTILCSDWFDEDGIEDYSIYSYTTDISKQNIIAFSPISNFQVLLPAGNHNLFIHIRDTLHCSTQFNITSVIVIQDSTDIDDFVNNLQNSTNNAFIQLLLNGNQNIVGQIITSLSQEFNQINTEIIQNAVANNIPIASISISSLGSSSSQKVSTPFNSLTLIEYNKRLNSYANIREYLMTFPSNLPITTSNSIKLQALAMAQLTQATNQLTRTSSMIASEKCYQLAKSLYLMATELPYEDVQNAANQISQCTSNVLSAINGPLQQRATALDLDFSRANNFPDDYETDLESDWSNPNLFADGNDFSWETTKKNRNLYYQKQIANQIISQSKETISLLTSALNIHLNIGQNLTMNTSSVFMLLETTSFQSLSNKLIQQIENTKIHLPSTINNKSTVSIRLLIQPLATADQFGSQSNTNLSRSISFSILDHLGNEIPIRTNVDHPIELIIPRDPNVVIPPMSLQNVTLTNHHLLFNLYYINLTQSHKNLSISLHFEMHSYNINLAYLLIYRFDNSPQLNSSINQIDGWSLFCPLNLTNESIYTYFIDNQLTVGHESVIFGLRELNSSEINHFCSNQSINSPPISNQPFHFSSNYELRTYTSGCYYLDKNNNWQSDGLIVGPLTNHYQTQCFSTHLTTFAGGFLVLPSPINWNYVFANADFMRNKTIYLTVIFVCLIYILLMIYARYKDKKDIDKLGVTILPDNRRQDRYFYQIIVFTGHRKDAGTKSKVQFIAAGDNDETSIRTFADPTRKILQRGGTDSFIMAVPKSLGLLDYVRIWHDNTGPDSSASWFLKYLIIRDLQTMEKSYFICQNWLAVEKNDGRIERVLPVAGEHQKREFSYLLSKQAYHSIFEGHLWFSIFARPPSNKFTRVQRCTCCFVLLFMSMLLNILYYDQAEEAKTNAKTNEVSLSFGPLHITSQQIGIGVIVELISFLPSLLLIQFFRRIQPRQTPSIREIPYKLKQKSDPEKTVRTTTKKRSQLTFPWWCLFLAYGFSFIIIVISIFFIIIRGIEFGDLKIQKWLTSLITGFFSSILLIQPIKIISFAIFFALIFRNSDNDKEAAEYLDNNNNNEEYFNSTEDTLPFKHQPRTQTNRLNEHELAYARSYRLKEIKMWQIIKEVLIYFYFLSMIYVVTYSNVQQNAFLQVNHLRKYFLNTRQMNQDFTKISTINEYWNWLENNFIENLRAQQWYNGDAPRNLSGFINDKSNRIIGWAIMRQLRVKTVPCHVKSLVSTCADDYSFLNEEKRSFQPGWINETTELFNSSISQAFQYKTSDQLNSYIYKGDHETYNSGGYVYEFRGRLSNIQNNLSQLHQLGWIDKQTRAVFIQLSLYNPNVDLFTSVILLVEFLSTGSLYSQSRIEPLSFQLFTSLSQLICAILYLIIIIYMMIEQIQIFIKIKLNYFRQFWSLIDLGIIGCSWASVGIYIWRYQQSTYIGNIFRETNGYVYVNLQLAVYVNDVFTFLLGFCCFFGTLKFLRLCRFDRRLSLFTETIRQARNDLFSFTCMFSIVFMAFIVLFYLLFSSKLWSCSTLLQTAQMLFEMMLMKFDAYELKDAAMFLGPFSFTLFILLVVFVCMSMLITIINQNFRIVRDNAKLHSNVDEHIWMFMLRKFQQWTGLHSKQHQFEIFDEQNRCKYRDPIEQFPEKVDQLLDALNRLYIAQQMPLLKQKSLDIQKSDRKKKDIRI